MAQVQQWAVLQSLHKGGGKETVIKLSPFGSTAAVAQANEEFWCQMGKCTGSTGFAALPWHAQSADTFKGQAVPELSSALLLLSCWAQEEAGVRAVKGMKVSNMHAHTLPTVWERALCSYVFGLALQSHNDFISLRRYRASEICISLREPPTSWEMLISFPRADVSLMLF